MTTQMNETGELEDVMGNPSRGI